jgi:hypothetical protein
MCRNQSKWPLFESEDIQTQGRGWTCGTQGEERKLHNVLVGKSEGRRPLGRPRRRWKDGMNWILGDWLGGVDSTGSGKGPVAGSCESSDEP